MFVTNIGQNKINQEKKQVGTTTTKKWRILVGIGGISHFEAIAWYFID